MKIGFIGAGKAGFSLGKYFKEKGLEVTGYYSIPETDAIEAARFTDTKHFSTIGELAFFNDLIFITTPDNVIQEIWDELKKLDASEKIIVHASGAMGSSVFYEESFFEQKIFSLHPLFAFYDRYESWKDLKDAVFTLEGSEFGRDSIRRIMGIAGNELVEISEKNKPLYHLGAVMASNAVIAALDMAVEYLEKCGFTRDTAMKALKPLFLLNATNAVENGTISSLTGPCERGDWETVKKHLDFLDDGDKELYIDISKRLTKLAEKKNPEKEYDFMEQFLNDYRKSECLEKGKE